MKKMARQASKADTSGQLIIFVKNPVLGEVKTRLAAEIGPQRAMEVYQRLVDYTAEVVAPLPQSKVVWYGNDIPSEDLWSRAHLARHPQIGSNLGERMAHAFEQSFQAGFSQVVIIGSDNAKIETRHLRSAFTMLSEYDVVIGPARDGGYYLLGLKGPLVRIFQGKSWSTSSVLKETLADLKHLGKSVFLLPELPDIDRAEDLKGTFLAGD